MKRCSRCQIEQSIDNFHRNRCMSDGQDHYCKECRRRRYSTLYAPGAPRHHAKQYKPRSEMSPEQVQRIRAQQRPAKRRYIAKPGNRQHQQHYYSRADVLTRMRARYHERMETEEGYAMRRREYMNQRRKTDPMYAKREDARIIISLMVRHGWMMREPCSVCGATEKIEGHHPDYGDPLRVVWLCKLHHRVAHHPHVAVVRGG